MTAIIIIICAALLIGAVLVGIWQMNRSKTTATNSPGKSDGRNQQSS